jgi:hypothetical protein
MPVEIRDSRTGKLWRKVPIAVLLFMLGSLIAKSNDSPKPVFVKATCQGKISSAVLVYFREGIRASQRYQLVPSLSDNGKMDVVLTVDISCTERSDMAAVALVYGKARCLSVKNCHLSIDGSSIRSYLCDSNAATECGSALFKAFDDYMSNPLSPYLKLQ